MATRQIGLEIKIVNREALSEIDKIVDNLNKKGISIKIDVSKGLEELEKVKNIVNEVNNKSTKIDIDTSNVEQASKKIDDLKQNINNASKKSLTTVDGEDVQRVSILNDMIGETSRRIEDLRTGSITEIISFDNKTTESKILSIQQKIEKINQTFNTLQNKNLDVFNKIDSSKIDGYKKSVQELEGIIGKLQNGESVKQLDLTRALGDLQLKITDVKNAFTQGIADNKAMEQEQKKIDQLKAKYEELKNKIKTLQDSDLFYNSKLNSKVVNPFEKIDTNNILEYSKQIDSLSSKINILSDSAKKIKELNNLKALTNVNYDKIINTETFSKIPQELKDSFSQANTELTKFVEKFRGTTLNVNQYLYTDAINNYVNSFKNLQNASNELEKLGQKAEQTKTRLTSMLAGKQTFGVDTSAFDNLQSKINSINTNTTVAQIKSLEQEIKNIGNNSSQIVRIENAIDSMRTKLEGIKGKYKDLVQTGDSVTQVQALETQITKLQEMANQLKQGKVIDGSAITREVSKGNTGLKQLENTIKNCSKAFQSGNKDVMSFGQYLQNALGKIGIYASSAIVFRKLFTEIKDGVSSVIELEDAMVSLRRVCNESDEAMKQFQSTATSTAQTLGVTASEYVDAVTSFKKMGYELSEAQELATTVTKYNLAGDIDNLEEATTGVISILKGFGLEAENVVNVTDSMNSAANQYAITAGDLTTILQRSSSAMSVAGNTLNESIAIGTVANEITQNSERTGNALKTFSMRLRGVSEDGEELSATLREDVMAYTKMTSAFKDTEGFDILKDDGSFKSTFEILKGIGSAWKELTDMQKSKLLQDMFGKLQGNVGAALLENYTKLDQVVKDIENTAGSVDQEFERYLDSTTGKLNQLSSLIQEKWVNAISSDFTKGAVDKIIRLVDTFGSLEGIVGLATTALLAFKGQAMTGAISSMIAYQMSLGASTTATALFSGALNTVKIALQGLSVAIASNPIGAIAVAITGAIALMSAFEKEIVSVADAMNNLNNASKDLQSVEKDYGNLDEIKRLQSELENTNLTLDERNEKEEQLLSLQKDMASSLENVTTYVDKEGNAYATNNKLIEQQLELKKQLAEIEMEQSYYDMMDNFFTDTDTTKWMNRLNSLFNPNSQITNQANTIAWGNNIFRDFSNYKQKEKNNELISDEEKKSYLDALEIIIKFNQAVMELDNNGQDISDKFMINVDTGELVKATDYIDEYRGTIDSASENQLNTTETVDGLGDVVDAADAAKEAIESLADAFGGAVDSISLINTALEEYTNYGGLTDDTISKILNTGDMELIQSLLSEDENYVAKNTALMERYGQAKQQALQDAVNQVNGVAQAEANATNQNAQSYQTDVINKTNAENAKTSAMINSATQGINATAQLVNTNGKNYNTDATNKTKTENSKVSAMQQAATLGISANAQMINAQGEGYQTDNTNYGRLVNNKVDLAEGGANQSIAAESQATAQKELQYKIDINNYRQGLIKKRDMLLELSGGNPSPEINFINNALSKVPEQTLVPSPPRYTTINVDSIQVATVPIATAPTKTVGGSSGGGSSSSSSSSTDYSLDDLESMRDNLYEINSYIERLETAMGILEAQIDRTWGKDKVDKIRAYNEYLQNQFDTTRNLQAQQQKEIFEIRKKLSAYGFDFDSNDITSDITNYNTRIDQLVNEANAMKSVDEASRNAKQKRQEEIRQIKELTDEYNDLRDAINDTKVEYQELATEMQEYYRGLADDVASGESTIATIIENAWEDKANKIKDSLDELQQKYEDLWEQEDWEDTKAEAYKELTDLEVEMQKAIKSGDTGKLAQLQEEYNERQEELNKTLRDKEREDLQDKIAQEQELIDKQKEEATTGDNMDKAIEQALKKGYIDLSGEYKTLADATEEYVNKTTDGYESQKLALSDIIKELETVKELYNDISTINSKADVVSDFTTYSNVSVPVNKSGYLMTSNLNSSTPNTLNNQTYNITINAADMTQSELENAIDNVLRDNGVYDN